MFEVNLAYFPIGRTTFEMEVAERYFRESMELLGGLTPYLMAPDSILASVEEMSSFIQAHPGFKPDLIVYQSITFADAEYIVNLMEQYDVPILVWSVREPSVGGRLRLNSLTGGNSTCNALHYFERDYDFMLGNAAEPQIARKLRAKLAAFETAAKLRRLTVGVVGEHPAGFYFSGVDERLLAKTTGVKLQRLNLQQLFEEAINVPEEQYAPLIEAAAAKVVGLNRGEDPTIKFAQFAAYLRQLFDERGIKAAAMRCWPDFFVELGAAPCSTLSQFIEDGLVSACEADINGAVSMYIQQELSGGLPPYLGDLVHVDEEMNTVSFWHCGAGAYSLANPSTGAKAGVHPNRKMGFTLEFGLKAGQVTISRLSQTSKGYRMLIMRGEALDRPQQFAGTSGEIRLNGNANEMVCSLMADGFEPHYSIVHADIAEELKELCKRLGIEAVIYP
ncbi:sulfoquinovose isomerase [Cohnella hongkongensis]|uniref:L-fucose/L-arabinose isomerase family protein n=1 Tax=Cohnella hongkongensis TaxID=178337 RepID=A0ABV9FBI4_9BACL